MSKGPVSIVPGSERFVDDVAQAYGADLLRFLQRRAPTPADARDLAQETYVRLLRLERHDLIQNPQAYLYRIAANLLYEFGLKRRSAAEGLRRWAGETSDDREGISLERQADSAALQKRVQEVLSELSPKCRAVLVLHRRDGLTYDEIGERLGVSSSMVKKYLSAGLKHCRARLAGAD